MTDSEQEQNFQDDDIIDYVDEFEDQCEFEIDQEAIKAENMLKKENNNDTGVRKKFDSADYAMANQKALSNK